MFAVGGCGGDTELGDSGYVEGFLGGVMADEPRAALVGRDVLSAGGTAADAAVAAYFTMAVTLPSGAGLGGGGVCLIYDPARKLSETLDFLPRAPAGRDAAYALPGNVRGMFAVHARHGRGNWAELLQPAEQFARQGHPISRAFARDLADHAADLRRHPETARAFGITGTAVQEGTPLRQVALSAILSSIRIRGAGDFYSGASGRQFVDAVQQVGGSLTIEDLRSYLPRLQTPLMAPVGDNVLYVSGGGGIVAGRVWSMLHDDDRYVDAVDAGARAHLLAEASARAHEAGEDETGEVSIAPETGAALIAGFDPSRRTNAEKTATRAIADNPPVQQNGASIVVVDRYGQMVACGYTMVQPFGAGVLAPGTGILLVPADTGGPPTQPAALALVNRVNSQIFLGAAVSGASPATIAAVPLDTAGRGMTLERAIAAPRLFDPFDPDIVVHEPAWEPSALARLRELGYTLRAGESLARINGFHCPEGLPRTPSCQFVSDPRGFGLSASADR